MEKIKIGFICVHNSCRSIIAEAICQNKYGHIFDVYSAGTEQYDAPKKDAIDILKKEYQIKGDFKSKLIGTLPDLDIVITMGCNVNCPNLPSKYREDFGVDDPSGLDEHVFKLTSKIIELKIDLLVKNLELGNIVLK